MDFTNCGGTSAQKTNFIVIITMSETRKNRNWGDKWLDTDTANSGLVAVIVMGYYDVLTVKPKFHLARHDTTCSGILAQEDMLQVVVLNVLIATSNVSKTVFVK